MITNRMILLKCLMCFVLMRFSKLKNNLLQKVFLQCKFQMILQN